MAQVFYRLKLNPLHKPICLEPVDSGRLNKWLILSFIFHLSIVSFFSIKNFFSKEEFQILENSIRVDLVALPDKTPVTPEVLPKKETPLVAPPLPPEPKNVATKSETKTDLSKKKSERVNTTDAIKRLQALESINQALSKEASDEASKTRIARQNISKGASISQGNSLTGLNRIHYESYLHQVDRHVKKYWTLPEWLLAGGHKARVLVIIDESGIAVQKQILSSSGNSEFDSLALEAIEKASPFPSPPEKLSQIISKQGVVFGFPE